MRDLDKVGLRFSSLRLIGQVLYEGVRGWRKNKIARTCCGCCDVGESACKLCTLWSRLLDWFVKLGVHGMGQRSAVKEGWSQKGSVRKLVSLLCGRNV